MSRTRDYVGGYRLVRLIRAGQSCEVWEGIKEWGGGRFALKVLRRDLMKNREEVGHLKREFEVAHGFKHPHLVQVLEFNFDGGVPYLVEEFFNAKNMKLILRQGRDSLAPLAAGIIEQGAEALYYLHTQSWVHCDVKPDNFLVNDDGVVKLIDFAIAQKQSSGGIARFLPFLRPKIRGTRSYMSPEQIRGEGLDARADLYSYGCVLFELVAGKPPFTGDSPDDLLKKHLGAAIPSLQAANDNVTPEFAELVRRMMMKKRESRPGSMWEFLKEFRVIHLFKTAPAAVARSAAKE
jgi:serine/threonine protein kinase